jgi:ankyrin repeat protein
LTAPVLQQAVRSVTEAFRSALNTGDVEGLELLMEQGGWGLVNAVYLEGMLPPLTVAARQGDVAVARLLLAHGARPEMPVRFNIQGQLHTGTALSTAALGDNQEMVTLLLSQNPTAEQLQCALLCGCRGGDGLVMSALLLRMSYEMDVWVRALVTAAHYGSTSVVPLLLERVEDQEERQQVLRLVLAKEQGSSPEGLLRLVEPCMPVDLSQVLWRNVMEAACRIGALDTVKLLMDKGINTAEAATSGLRIALRLGGGYNDSHVRVARYLLKRRVPCGEFEPDKYGSMLRMVLDTGTDFSVGEALREGAGSIFNEFNESVASILERGVGFKPADVTSAILAAAEAGYAPTISQLRKVGVKPSMEDGQERARANAILLTACRNNTYRVVLELLKWGGVDVDARTEKGYTPIMMCLQRGDMLMVKRLLEAGADLDAAERQFDRLLQWTDALFSFNSSMSEKTARAWEELVKVRCPCIYKPIPCPGVFWASNLKPSLRFCTS